MPYLTQRQTMANAIRALTMDSVQSANSGHPGMPMGMADAATVLFCQHMKFDANKPDWPDRDRFILSAGHGSMLLYALLYLTGYKDMTLDQLRNFRKLGAATAGHPEFGHAKGIETTTGPLGQGLANAVGMAMAERHLAARFGSDLVDHFTYVIAGDGCLMEGISHEAASLAGHLSLGRLIVLFDDNGISIDGATDLSISEDTSSRFFSQNWQVLDCDGHNADEVDNAITEAKKDPRPSLIRCKTVIGFGAPTKQGSSSAHGSPLGDSEIALARKELSWPHLPFHIPEEIITEWRAAGSRGEREYGAWKARYDASKLRFAFEQAMSGDISKNVEEAVVSWKEKLARKPEDLASRVASQKALQVIYPFCPSLFGGSADLTGSNNTRIESHQIYDRSDYQGNYVHYGVREHGMAAAMNGIALHGGLIPYAGTFLVFTDYCRPAIRLSALMKQRVIYVMTHDSIGLGEDGPTHQPVEHLAALRAIPNLSVFRPADIVETVEAWECALKSKTNPSILALSRQGLPQFRTGDMHENKTANGAYIVSECVAPRQITLLASGSEVAIAIEARDILSNEGVHSAVVSVPSMDLFKIKGKEYQNKILGKAPRIAIEAGLRQSWDWLLGSDDIFIGMTDFGASGNISELYEHFGITADAAVEAARKLAKSI